MSVDVYANFAIYFKINPKLRVSVFKEYKACANDSCQLKGKERPKDAGTFCPGCGKECEVYQKVVSHERPNERSFCAAAMNDEDFLQAEHEHPELWVYEPSIQRIDRDLFNVGGDIDLSEINGAEVIASALEEDPRLDRVIPAFCAFYECSEEEIELKFGILVSYC